MEDTNLYDDIISNFKKEKELNKQKIAEKYNESINSFCDNLYSIVFNPKLKTIIKTDNDSENIKITDENYLIYIKFIYIEQEQKFILVFNSLNLDKIFDLYKDHIDAFIFDISTEFNKRYKKFKIQICESKIYKETEYYRLNNNRSLKPIPNLYRYKIILNHLSCDTK